MVKLTVDLIQMAQQRINPVRDRELVLRGYKIAVLENLGATLDQFDTLDVSDNEIRRLDGLPLLARLTTIVANNNRLLRVGAQLADSAPNLHTLVLTNNCLQELADLEPLVRLPCLEHLSLLGNPVVTRPHYRLHVIHLLPSVRVLDFRRVRLAERQRAAKLFAHTATATAAGGRRQKLKQQQQQLTTAKNGTAAGAVKTFVPGESLTPTDEAGVTRGGGRRGGASAEQVRLLKAAIARATSLPEIERLQQLLLSGAAADSQQLRKLAAGETEAVAAAAAAGAGDSMETAADGGAQISSQTGTEEDTPPNVDSGAHNGADGDAHNGADGGAPAGADGDAETAAAADVDMSEAAATEAVDEANQQQQQQPTPVQ